MFVFPGRIVRPDRHPAARSIAGVLLFTLMAFVPYGAGAAVPVAGTALPGPARTADHSAATSAVAAPASSLSPDFPEKTTPPKTTPQDAPDKPKVQAGKKKASPAKGKKASGRKKRFAKSSIKKTAKPVRRPSAAAAAQAGDAAALKPDALRTFPVSSVPMLASAETVALPVAETWHPLMARLAKDGLDQTYLRAMFGRLGDSYSHVPMGTKINELFTRKYMPKPPCKTPAPRKSAAPSVYKWALRPESVAKCREYLERHKDAFTAVEKEYGIPREVVAGLLMVETKLGAYLGASSSFWSLACLAASETPDRVAPALQALPLPMTPDKMEWVSKLLRERSAWAYKELLALTQHCRENDLDPLVIPGSVYGAIGLCQFMPSNLSKFAVDGNKDGKIDLFDPADAIASVGNYLKRHGWESENSEARHTVIKKYNKSTVYANTILALAEAVTASPGDSTETMAPAGVAGEKEQAAKPGIKKSGAEKTPGGKKTGGKVSAVKAIQPE